MILRRLIGIAIIFILGIAVGGLVLRAAGVAAVSPTEAQRRALHLLDQQPVVMSIGDNRIVEAVKKIAPAVVNIDTMGRVKSDDDHGASLFMDQEIHGKGSGVILTPDGYIVTNSHVIDGANRIRVTLPSGQWYYAHLIGQDPQNDLAVIRIEASNLPIAELGDSDHLQVGEWSVAVGNPLGLGSTVTVGVISALNRHNLQVDEGRKLDGAIQTDAAINRGNSGGALADINGRLVGINTAILSSTPSGGSIGLGFSIPVNTVRRVARDLIATGRTQPVIVQKPWLGISYGAVPENKGLTLGLSPYRGVEVRRVLPESPASLAGLQQDDIILSIDGKEIGEERDVREALSQRKVGEKSKLHILRPGERHERDLSVLLQERPDTPPLTP
jgi:serine protease Do